jgi:hypothetical protein
MKGTFMFGFQAPRRSDDSRSSLSPAGTRRGRRGALAATLAALIAAPVATLSYAPAGAAEPAPLAATDFKGVNWAMPGDNFTDGAVVPEGLSTSDSYDTVYAKAAAVYAGFKSTAGANTVRLPINADSVPGTAWGDAYAGAVAAATDAGFNVILSDWEGASPNGRIDDMNAFNAMWDSVISKWASNDHVFFETMNEPYGYSGTDWANVAAGWISAHPAAPRGRMIISGTGYNQDVTPLCNDSRFDGTYLSIHLYTFFYGDTHTYDQWVNTFTSRLGNCASRTVLDEFGAPTDDGRNYNDPASTDEFVPYIRAATDVVHDKGMGAVYWPALGGKHTHRPDYDWYSLYALQGSGTNLSLSVRNTTMIDRLRHAWGIDG